MDNGETMMCWGQGVYGKSLYLRHNFVVNLNLIKSDNKIKTNKQKSTKKSSQRCLRGIWSQPKIILMPKRDILG